MGSTESVANEALRWSASLQKSSATSQISPIALALDSAASQSVKNRRQSSSASGPASTPPAPTTGDDILKAVVLGVHSAPGNLHLVILVGSHIRVQERPAGLCPQVDEGSGKRDVYAVVEKRPDPLDVVAPIPTENVGHVE